MRKNFMKKAVAVTLSAAMAFSLSAVSFPTTASAAVKLNATTKNLTVGKTFTLKLNKAGQKKWKITKAASNKEKVVKVQKKKMTKKKVVVKALKKGNATVTVTLKKKNGKSGTKKLKCKFTVKKATPTPTTPTEPTTTPTEPTTTPTEPSTPVGTDSITVETQEELLAALNQGTAKKITLVTEAENIDIPAGTYDDVELIVNAPSASITNEALFKRVEIQAISPNTWTEKTVLGTGNAFEITGVSVKFVLDAGAKARSVTLKQGTSTGTYAKLEIAGTLQSLVVSSATKLDLDMQSGTLGTLEVSAPNSDINVTGKTADNKAIEMSFAPTAVNTNLITAVKANIRMRALVNITLAAGAADSTIIVEKEVEGQKLNIWNKTGANVKLYDRKGVERFEIPDGNTGEVEAPTTTDDTTNPTSPTTPNFNGGTDQSGTTNETAIVNVDNVTGEGVLEYYLTKKSEPSTTTSGTSITYTVSGAAINLDIKGIDVPSVSSTSGCVIRYDVAYQGLGMSGKATFLDGYCGAVTNNYSNALKDAKPTKDHGLMIPLKGSVYVGQAEKDGNADVNVINEDIAVTIVCSVVKIGNDTVNNPTRTAITGKINVLVNSNTIDGPAGNKQMSMQVNTKFSKN